MSPEGERCPHCGGVLHDAAAVEPVEPVDLDVLDPGPASSASSVASSPLGGRRRLLALAGIAMVVAVVASMVVLGDGTDEPEDEAPAAGSESTVTLTPTTTVRGDGDGLLPEPSGLALLAVGGAGRVERIELDTGRVSSPDVFLPAGSFLLAIDGAVVGGDSEGLRVYRPLGPREGVDLGPANAARRSPRPGHLWVVRPRPDGPVLEEISLDGDRTADPVELPRFAALAGATTAGVVVNTPSGAMVLEPDQRAATMLEGTVIAVHEDTIVRLHCNPDLSCGTRIGSVDDLGRHVDIPDRPFQFGTRFSPDGRTLALFVPARQDTPGGFEIVLVDVAAGAVVIRVPLTGASFQPWDLTNEWLFAVDSDSNSVLAVHRMGQPTIEIPTDLGDVRAVVAVDDDTWR